MKRKRPLPTTAEEHQAQQRACGLRIEEAVIVIDTHATDAHLVNIGIFWDPDKRKAIGQVCTIDRRMTLDDKNGIPIILFPDPLGHTGPHTRYYPYFMLKRARQ